MALRSRKEEGLGAAPRQQVGSAGTTSCEATLAPEPLLPVGGAVTVTP
jgi:hypothetical protein